MPSFTTDVCERCDAQFVRESNLFRDRKVHKITITTYRQYGQDQRQIEICSPCRDSFYELFKNWKAGYQ